MSKKTKLVKQKQGRSKKMPTKGNLSITSRQFFAGPLPHPNILMQYDRILPGAAERILKMAEKQLEHRQKMENTVIQSDIKNSKRGIWFAFLISIAVLAAAVLSAWLRYPYLAAGLTIIDLATLAGVFIYGSKQKAKTIEKKKKQDNE